MYAVCVPLSISKALVEGVNSAPAIRVRANLYSRKLSAVTEKSVRVHFPDYQPDHTNPYLISIDLPARRRYYTFRGSPFLPRWHFSASGANFTRVVPLASLIVRRLLGCWPAMLALQRSLPGGPP